MAKVSMTSNEGVAKVSMTSNDSRIIDELVAGSLILYPRYWDWQTSQFCRPEDVCSRLMNKEQMDVSLWIKFCRTGRNFLNLWLRK